MKLLQLLQVGQRLTMAFGLLIFLLITSSSLALYQFKEIRADVDKIVNENNRKSVLLNGVLRNHMSVSTTLRDLLLVDEADRAALLEKIDIERKQSDGWRKELATIPTNAAGHVLRKEYQEKQDATRSVNNLILDLVKTGEIQAARKALYAEVLPLVEKRNEVVQRMANFQDEQSALDAKNIENILAFSRSVLIGFGAVAVLLGALLGWLIIRSLTRPLGQATQIAESIAQGRLDHVIAAQSQDETGRLLTSMGRMQEQLQAVLSAQSEMAQRHDAGHTSHQMDDARFPGDYGRMVRECNALVGSHVALQQRLVQVMGRYAIGDLAEDMERLPGEKAALSETMDTVKRNLAAVNTEIGQLVNAAAQGDFSVRGHAERFQYEFKAMVEGLNRLMGICDRNLEALSILLKAVAAGDLTQRMEGEFHGVFARMRDDANTTVDQLTGIVGRIQQSSAGITTAVGEIATGNQDLSQRTEQQAANLEETAASMEELTSTVKQNAEHAQQANKLAMGATNIARAGGEVVDQVVATMAAIENSSKQIAEIITVIDGIAFQTNILALNAAVEAARAGEQGRGFTVVASEVRSLAQRSATAAKEIKTLIDNSVGKVADGSVLVRKAGATMGEVVESVQRVTDIMGEISAASQEQSSGIEQVNYTIVQMDETTQQNAALVEEASAAAHSMQDQVGHLTAAVRLFKLKE